MVHNEIQKNKENQSQVNFLEVVDTWIQLSEKQREKCFYVSKNVPWLNTSYDVLNRLHKQEWFWKDKLTDQSSAWSFTYQQNWNTIYYCTTTVNDFFLYWISYSEEEEVRIIGNYLTNTEKLKIIYKNITEEEKQDIFDAYFKKEKKPKILSSCLLEEDKLLIVGSCFNDNEKDSIVYSFLSEYERSKIIALDNSKENIQNKFNQIKTLLKWYIPAWLFIDKWKIYLRVVSNVGGHSRMMEIKFWIKDSVNFLDKFPLKRDPEKSVLQSCTYETYQKEIEWKKTQSFNQKNGWVTYQNNELIINNTLKTVIKNVQARCSLSHDTCFVIRNNELYNCIISQEGKVQLEKINTLKIEWTVTSIGVYNDLLVLNTIASWNRWIWKRIFDTLQWDSWERVLFYDMKKNGLLNTLPFHWSIEPTEIRDMHTGEYLWKMKKTGQLFFLNTKLSDDTLVTWWIKKTILMKTVAKELMSNYDTIFEALDWKISDLENKIDQREKLGNWQLVLDEIVNWYAELLLFMQKEEKKHGNTLMSYKVHIDQLFFELVKKLHSVSVDDEVVLTNIHGLSENAPNHKKIYKELYDSVVNTPIVL